MSNFAKDSQIPGNSSGLEQVFFMQRFLLNKYGRRRFEVQKNDESSRLYPFFTSRWDPKGHQKAKSSIFSQLSQNEIQSEYLNNISYNSYPLPPVKLSNSSSNDHHLLYSNVSACQDPNTQSLHPLPQDNLASELKIKTPAFNESQEIELLKTQLKEKNQEIHKLKSHLLSSSKTPDFEILSKISKVEFDKNQVILKRKLASQSLEQQISAKTLLKRQEAESKQRELIARLETLKLLKQQESKNLLEKISRAQEYKSQLDVQQIFKGSHTLSPSPSVSSPQYPQSDYPQYTKRHPKTLSYNPITNTVTDTSPYLKSHPLLNSN